MGKYFFLALLGFFERNRDIICAVCWCVHSGRFVDLKSLSSLDFTVIHEGYLHIVPGADTVGINYITWARAIQAGLPFLDKQ